MASQVLSGSSNPTYTNNTGQNVRIVINFMRSLRTTETISLFGRGSQVATETLTINWAGISQTYSTTDTSVQGGSRGTQLRERAIPVFIGRNLAFVQSIIAPDGQGVIQATVAALSSNNALAPSSRAGTTATGVPGEAEVALAFPTEIILAPNQTFSAVCGIHNIVVIPENG